MPPESTPEPTRENITGLVLAGGAARRMGGVDKGLTMLAERPLIDWVLEALRPQTLTLLISANRNLDRYAATGCPVVTDRLQDFQGPLAGIAAAMARIDTAWLLVSPCDTPLIPRDLGCRLADALAGQAARIAIAADPRRTHPLHALIPRTAAADLDAYLATGRRSVTGWLDRHTIATARFDGSPSPFSNLNRPEDARAMAQQLRAFRSGTAQ